MLFSVLATESLGYTIKYLLVNSTVEMYLQSPINYIVYHIPVSCIKYEAECLAGIYNALSEL